MAGFPGNLQRDFIAASDCMCLIYAGFIQVFGLSAAQLWSLQKALFDTWMHELRLKDGRREEGQSPGKPWGPATNSGAVCGSSSAFSTTGSLEQADAHCKQPGGLQAARLGASLLP